MTTRGYGDVPTTHLKCRALGHAWDPTHTFVERRERVEVLVVALTCARCSTERRDVIRRRDGARESRPAYAYAEGYRIAGRAAWGSVAAFNGEVRRELYGRLLEGETR